MTTHELAQALLAGPDQPVSVKVACTKGAVCVWYDDGEVSIKSTFGDKQTTIIAGQTSHKLKWD